MIFGFLFVFFGVYAQSTIYYVSLTGIDNPSCGGKDFPCASINQVLINYPGESYVVSIEAGMHLINEIVFEKNASVIFQGAGAGNTIVMTAESWNNSDTYIANTPSSGFEFHDLSLDVSRLGRGNFTYLESKGNKVAFFNVVVTCKPGIVLVHLFGGVVVVDNASFTDRIGYVILKNYADVGTDTSVNISNSTFSNMWSEMGGLVFLTGPGVTEVVLDRTSFYNVSTTIHFVTANLVDAGGAVTVTNNVFNITAAQGPAVRVGLSRNKSATFVQNTTFIDCTSTVYFSGALGINRSDTSVVDNPVALDTLRFQFCTGPFAGALYVGYASLNLTRSLFAASVATEPDFPTGNDVFIAYPSASARFQYSITDSYSSSALPKAVVWTDDTNSSADISNTLPEPPEDDMHLLS